MKPGNTNYDKIMNLLRKSRPEPDSTEEIESEVINRITVVLIIPGYSIWK